MGKVRLPEVLRYYGMWVSQAQVGFWEMARMRNGVLALAYQPRISILVPVYNTIHPWLEKALDSVLSQTYPNWELCICDDNSTEDRIRETLCLYERLDARIRVKYLEENKGIAGATNHALSLAGGEFVGLLDHDDELAPNALFEVVGLLQYHPDADLIYSDEDKIDESGKRTNPHFKMGWSLDLAMSCNYMNHFSVYRRSLLEEIGGWRMGFDGAQDLDLVQRFSERTDKIYHIPKILYHWRAVSGSTAVGAQSKPYTHERARRAYEDSLKRQGVAGSVQDGFAPNTFRIEREIDGEPQVSVIIPATKQVPQRCLQTLHDRTTYPNYEIIVVDTEHGTMTEHIRSGEQKDIGRLDCSHFAGMCNAAIRHTKGDYILLLSPDLEATSEAWLENLLQHAQRSEVGAVGGKLMSPSGEVLQAGLILYEPEGNAEADALPRFYRYCDPSIVGFRYMWDLTRNCSAVSSDCSMFRRDVFEELEGFDEAHFDAEFADVDMCLRMRERGYLIVYTPYAEFTYHRSLTRHHALGPNEAGYVRDRWPHVLNADPYYNPNLYWQPDGPHLVVSKLRTPGPRKKQPPATDKVPEASAPFGARIASSPPVPDVESRNPTVRVAPPVASARQDVPGSPSPFFVVGYGRSGTTWLETSLNSHPEVLCKGEGMFFGRSIRLFETQQTLADALANCEDLRVWHSMRENRWGSRSFEEDLPGMVKALTDHILGTELVRSGKRVVGDKTPHYVSYLEEIHESYPSSKIIHMIRDGRDVAISNVHAVWQNARDKGGPVDLEPEILQRRDAYFEDREGFLANGESIFTENQIKQLARSWNERVGQGMRQGHSLFGERYLEVRYERLLHDSYSELTRLFEFLEVDCSPQVVARVIEENRFEKMAGRPQGQEDSSSFYRKGIVGEWKEIFADRDKHIFKKEAGIQLVELGYEKDFYW
jgi:GT2 family glycosyltransferase